MACLLFIASCAGNSKESLLEEFEHFVEEVDRLQNDYSEEDWQMADAQFIEYYENHLPNYKEQLTASEREKINRLVGKYQAIKLKHDAGNIANELKDVFEQATSAFEELTN